MSHGRVVASFLKNLSSCSATFVWPVRVGCVPSPAKSPSSYFRPSLFAFVPLAHRYGPQLNHGARVFPPLSGSKFRADSPLICFSISHFTDESRLVGIRLRVEARTRIAGIGPA